jgi:proteasomal ATPase-associated factor 1
MSSQTKIVLPVVTIQPTFKTVISEVDSGVIPSEIFWVSCYKQSQPSVHAKIHVQLDETYRDIVNFVPKDGDVQIERRTTAGAVIDSISWQSRTPR